MHRIVKKLGNNSGESIAELLISILVSVLGITLLAIMIQTSSRLILSSTAKIKDYAVKENRIVKKEDTPDEECNVNLLDGDSSRLYNLYKDCKPLKADVFEMPFGKKKIIAFERNYEEE
jgi:hypothetical protein